MTRQSQIPGPDPIPIGDDVDETASVVELVPEMEEPDRPVMPPGREQDLEALKPSVNWIVGAMDTLLRQIPVYQEMPVQPVGHVIKDRDTREPSPLKTLKFVGSGAMCPGGHMQTPLTQRETWISPCIEIGFLPSSSTQLGM